MASTVIQVYLKQILESFFHKSNPVRLAALGVTTLILKQGLVHPVQVIYVQLHILDQYPRYEQCTVNLLEVGYIPKEPPAHLKMNACTLDHPIKKVPLVFNMVCQIPG